ncbi:hypothetical protein N7468_002047 [Penicillium chermesinum]|uniref:ribonuclease H n=1 Tax=Penicillium chermesinum TaxID=63820 RepID=A0A9W9PI06_9EURO|nr:uncharacterized protein N7468_002047 [Penicillium chermesinum]KAJ5247064.1 hypothetical protein N7468_002047 [Penicillium chermesinum]
MPKGMKERIAFQQRKNQSSSQVPLGSLEDRVAFAKYKAVGDDTFVVDPIRRFDADAYPDHFQPFDIEVSWGNWIYVACPDATTKCSKCQRFPYHQGCVILSIDGKCEAPSQTPDKPRASMAVFFGHENIYNLAVEIEEERHTVQVAELKACIAALVKAIDLFQDEKKGRCEMDQTWPLHTLVIKSHSNYIVQGISEWLPKWKANGFKNCKGKPVANDSLWRLVDLWIRHLEVNAQVLFWLVPREKNIIAESMSAWVLTQPVSR